MEWISVKDRLPEPETEVLIYEPEFIQVSLYSFTGPYGRKQKIPVFNDNDDEQPSTFFPTHWMPLPSPPSLTDNK